MVQIFTFFSDGSSQPPYNRNKKNVFRVHVGQYLNLIWKEHWILYPINSNLLWPLILYAYMNVKISASGIYSIDVADPTWKRCPYLTSVLQAKSTTLDQTQPIALSREKCKNKYILLTLGSIFSPSQWKNTTTYHFEMNFQRKFSLQ